MATRRSPSSPSSPWRGSPPSPSCGGWRAASGGPVAGAVAGLAAAVSAAADRGIDVHLEPEPHRARRARSRWPAPGGHGPAGIAGGGSWPHSGRRSRCSATPRRRPAADRRGAASSLDARRRRLGWVDLGVLAVFAVAYLPLLINELTTGGSELRAALDYLAAGGPGAQTTRPFPSYSGSSGCGCSSWPLTGLITDGFVAGVRRQRRGHRDRGLALARERTGALGRPLAGPRPALVDGVPDARRAEPGDGRSRAPERPLPRVRRPDGLHAARARSGGAGVRAGAGRIGWSSRRLVGPILAAVGVVALLGWNLTHLPPAVHPDGGFPAGEAAAARVDAVLATAGVDRPDVDPAAVAARLQVDRGDGLSPGPSRPRSTSAMPRRAWRQAASIRRRCRRTAASTASCCCATTDSARRSGRAAAARRRRRSRRTAAARPGARCSTGSRPRRTASSRSTARPRHPGSNRERRRPRRRRSLSPRPGRWRAVRVVPWKCL